MLHVHVEGLCTDVVESAVDVATERRGMPEEELGRSQATEADEQQAMDLAQQLEVHLAGGSCGAQRDPPANGIYVECMPCVGARELKDRGKEHY